MIPQEQVERFPVILAAANLIWQGVGFVVLSQNPATVAPYYFWFAIVSPPVITLQLGVLILLLDFQALRVLVGVCALSLVLSAAQFAALVHAVLRLE